MIPAKTRAAIERVFDLYGTSIAMVSSDIVPPSTLYVVGDSEQGFTLHGSVRNINWAMDVRDNSLVPECYDEDASTWA